MKLISQEGNICTWSERMVIAIFIVICVAVLIGVFLLAIGMISAICRGLKEDDEDDEDKPSAGT